MDSTPAASKGTPFDRPLLTIPSTFPGRKAGPSATLH